MNEYLSIGEVAQLKNVTIKALRYYEKIGILLPAYINEGTGYRYYKMEQMVTLDLILACLELGIPLKRFPTYLSDNGVLNIDLILQDGMQMAKQEIARINRSMEKLKNMSLHLEESEQFPDRGSSCTRSFPERFLLLEPMQELYPTQKQYISALTILYFRMEEGLYTNLYKQGLLYITREGTTRCYTYNEVEKSKSTELAATLPAGYFTCMYTDWQSDAPWLEWVKPFLHPDAEKRTVLLQERYERQLAMMPFWELEVLPDTVPLTV